MTISELLVRFAAGNSGKSSRPSGDWRDLASDMYGNGMVAPLYACFSALSKILLYFMLALRMEDLSSQVLSLSGQNSKIPVSES
jgi:hypothetical protein